MPDSLLFNGTTNYIRFGPGTIVGTGPLTVVFIVKISTDAADFKNFLGWNATDGFFQMGNANPRPLGTYTGANLESSAFTVSATEGWIVVGFSVDDTGANIGRFHKFVYGGAWTHSAGDTNNINDLAACTAIYIGAHTAGTANFFPGNILIAGWWDSQLTDVAIEALAANQAAWVAAAPTAAWRFDTLSPISSFVGSSNEVSRVGTTLDAGDAPAGWVDLTVAGPGDNPPIGIAGRGAGW